MVDDEDFERLSKLRWYYHDAGYAKAKIDGKFIYAHHLVIGKPPSGKRTHHKDGDTWNNQKSNLEHTTPANHNHIHKPNRNNSNPVGVYSVGKTIFASITIGGKNVYLGSFPTKEIAAEAYEKAAKELYK